MIIIKRLIGTLILTVCLVASVAAVADDAAAKPTGNRFEVAIKHFEMKDKKSPPPPHAILFLGSSSIRFWKLDKWFTNMDVINRGFGGSEISDSIYFFDRVVTPYHPRQIVFYAGDNDIAAGKSPEQVAKDFASFTSMVHKTLPGTKITFLAIKPSIARWKLVDKMRQANVLIKKQVQADPRLEYIDTFSALLDPKGQPRKDLFRKDGLHLNEDGYALWTGLLYPHLLMPKEVSPKK